MNRFRVFFKRLASRLFQRPTIDEVVTLESRIDAIQNGVAQLIAERDELRGELASLRIVSQASRNQWAQASELAEARRLEIESLNVELQSRYFAATPESIAMTIIDARANNPMKVWLLQSGDSSYQYPVGIFSSEANALKAKAARQNPEDNHPEEWELDEVPGWACSYCEGSGLANGIDKIRCGFCGGRGRVAKETSQ